MKWCGDLSDGCNVCKRPFEKFMYDAKMAIGPWANLCEVCFTMHAVGLGTGQGQKYERQEDGTYLKVGQAESGSPSLTETENCIGCGSPNPLVKDSFCLLCLQSGDY